MSELAGYLMEVRVKAGEDKMSAGGADGLVVEGIDNATLNRLAEILEITSFSDTWKRRLGGIKDSNVSLSGNYIPGDAGQLVLDPGDTCWVALFPQGSSYESGDEGKQVKMIVENFENNATADGKQEMSSSLQGNGEPETIAKAAS